MVRLIFAKIWDERFDQGGIPEFRIVLNEDPEVVKERVAGLFNQVKEELVEDGVFDATETITLDAKSVAWVVGQLETYSLLRTDKDVVGAAFEVFAESKLVGEKGEFFTPREVVRVAVDLVNPEPGQRILDPACGSGGFLIHAMDHVWRSMDYHPRNRHSPQLDQEKRDIAKRCFFGIDKEIDLVKIAKAYMAIAGDGRGGIVQENTLHAAAEFQGRARELFTVGNSFKKFDVIFTNPPFGSKIKVLKDEAAQFALGHIWQRVDGEYVQTGRARDTDPQILFAERCVDMLEDGGTLAIVLPETFFHAPKYHHIFAFLLKGNNIKAVIDLPHNTFRPHNNAKTCLLILQKAQPQQPYITMGVAEQMGHDHEGRPMFRFDNATEEPSSEIWDDLSIIRCELKDIYSDANEYIFLLNVENIKDGNYVPRYYWPRANKDLEHADGITPLPLQQLLDEGIVQAFTGHGSPGAEYKGVEDGIPYIRVSDIVNWELYRNPTAGVPRHVYESVKGKNGVTLAPRDIIFVRRGSYRIGTVAMASPFDSEVLLTRELVILRVSKADNEYGIDPYYLLYLLSHDYTQKQLYQKTMIDTTLPNIGSRWKELLLPIFDDRSQRREVASQVKSVIDAKWQALTDLANLKKRLGKFIT